ncbi:MAG: T9SS type A sorting domain-containing protein [Flavobacteriales bacterium]|nr:T9SS type A sorting domain-containing protein [Flavobacteriales bacterium]
MKIKLLLLFNLIIGSFFAQNFYDRATVQKIEIFFAFTNWDAQLDAATSTDAYIIADSVRINGIKFDSVGVKYKGNSSYNANNNKNPLHINLDYVKGKQDYQGYTNIKLQNGYQDPSMIREVLSYAILEQYMDCPKANFANVYINGTLRGVYSNAESINDKFNGEHYYNSKETYFKCNPIGGAGPGASVSPDLKYISMDSSAYFNGYELQTDFGWNKLVDLINVLNNDFQNIESKLDVDRALWMLAFNNVLVNLDSYSGAFRQNYYLTWDLNDRFVPTIWDLNMSFAGFPGGTGSGSYTATTLDPLSNSSSANHPLIVKLMSNPMYKRMYLAHLRTIVQEVFESQDFVTKANNIRTTIDSYVQADPFKFYTYTQYQNSLTTAVTGGGGPGGGQSIPGIKALMDARVTFFNSNSNYLLAAPSITAYATSNSSPSYGSSIFITATCTNETSVFLGYRFSKELKFNRVQMYDDGAHGDGAAGDHVYGAAVTLNGVNFHYYIYAENANAGKFSPQRAEHEFYNLTISMPYAVNGDVLINEVLASNNQYGYDANGESDDWIELYNTKSTGVDLSGLYLSDLSTDLGKWPFPAGTTIPANGRIIVWCDNDIEQTGLHANFKLSSLGDNVIFSNGLTIFDQIAIGAQTQNVSYSRCPDGGVNFDYVTPTFNAVNTCFVGINELEEAAFTIFPNPTNSSFTIKTDEKTGSLLISDLQGRIIYQANELADEQKIDASNWNAGYYLVSLISENGQIQTKKVVKN